MVKGARKWSRERRFWSSTFDIFFTYLLLTNSPFVVFGYVWLREKAYGLSSVLTSQKRGINRVLDHASVSWGRLSVFLWPHGFGLPTEIFFFFFFFLGEITV